MNEILHFTVLPLIQPTPDSQLIDRNAILDLCSTGLSECPPEDRCAAWLVLFRVFPSDPVKWADKESECVEFYRSLLRDFGMIDWDSKGLLKSPRKEITGLDDDKLMMLIHADIARTGRHIFFLPTVHSDPIGSSDDAEGRFTYHMRRLERILYVFARANPPIGYFQGFNELVVPLYFTMVSALYFLGNDILEAEALTFLCFQTLIGGTEINQFYVVHDDSNLHYRMKLFVDLMRKHLPSVQEILDMQNINPLHYCFRWFNLLFGQEYQLPTLLIIWDALIAHIDDLMNFTYYVGIAHVESIKDGIKKDDFAETISTLQRGEVKNVYAVLRRANELYRADRTLSFFGKVKAFMRRRR
jgi:hypothetical protein